MIYGVSILNFWENWPCHNNNTLHASQYHFDGLVQVCSNSSAWGIELLQSCTKPSIYDLANLLLTICIITGDPLHSRAACTQPCNVNTHSRAHCSPGARLCEQRGHGCVNNWARLCASARLCRGSPVTIASTSSNTVSCPSCHYWDHYSSAMSSWYPTFRWVAVTKLNDRIPAK